MEEIRETAARAEAGSSTAPVRLATSAQDLLLTAADLRQPVRRFVGSSADGVYVSDSVELPELVDLALVDSIVFEAARRQQDSPYRLRRRRGVMYGVWQEGRVFIPMTRGRYLEVWGQQPDSLKAFARQVDRARIEALERKGRIVDFAALNYAPEGECCVPENREVSEGGGDSKEGAEEGGGYSLWQHTELEPYVYMGEVRKAGLMYLVSEIGESGRRLLVDRQTGHIRVDCERVGDLPYISAEGEFLVAPSCHWREEGVGLSLLWVRLLGDGEVRVLCELEFPYMRFNIPAGEWGDAFVRKGALFVSVHSSRFIGSGFEAVPQYVRIRLKGEN